MQVLLISDIHSNLPAPNAVLESFPAADQIWCLGDVVGYGPYPNETIERLKALPNLVCLLGNHDAAALGFELPLRFNLDARKVIDWTFSVLKEENRAWLEQKKPSLQLPLFNLAHGSPRHPIWEYILSPTVAGENIDLLEDQIGLFGHTHLPILFQPGIDQTALYEFLSPEKTYTLKPRNLLNPGSVGQPRDQDARASCILMDTDNMTFQLHRVPYPIEKIQARMEDLALPERLINRLSRGI